MKLRALAPSSINWLMVKLRLIGVKRLAVTMVVLVVLAMDKILSNYLS
jgi:hypothetical protein